MHAFVPLSIFFIKYVILELIFVQRVMIRVSSTEHIRQTQKVTSQFEEFLVNPFAHTGVFGNCLRVER
jgi:hypothetical protein